MWPSLVVKKQVVQDTNHCHVCIMSVMLFRGVQLTLMALGLMLLHCVCGNSCVLLAISGEKSFCSTSPKGRVWIILAFFFKLPENFHVINVFTRAFMQSVVLNTVQH